MELPQRLSGAPKLHPKTATQRIIGQRGKQQNPSVILFSSGKELAELIQPIYTHACAHPANFIISLLSVIRSFRGTKEYCFKDK